MFTPLNILFIVLAICAILVTIFLSLALYRLSQTLKSVDDVIEKANHTVDQVNTYLMTPLKIAMQVATQFKNVLKLFRKDDEE